MIDPPIPLPDLIQIERAELSYSSKIIGSKNRPSARIYPTWGIEPLDKSEKIRPMQIYSLFKSFDGEQNSFQGIGQRTLILRFSNCNLRCSFCDTRYAIYPESTKLILTPTETIDQINQLSDNKIKKLTITGGEPLLQTKELIELIRLLEQNGYLTSIETNGSLPLIAPAMRDEERTRFVIDYKLPTSRMEQLMMTQLFALFPGLGRYDVFKLVIKDRSDWVRTKQILHMNLGKIGLNRIFLSPCMPDLEAAELIRWMNNDPDFPEGCSISFQAHKFLIWPEEQ